QRKFDAEMESARAELRDQEKRLAKREDLHDRKLETLSIKEETLAKQADALQSREEGIAKKEEEIADLLEKQKRELLRIADLTPEQAHEAMLSRVEDEARHDVAVLTRKIVDDAENQAREKAREITLMAVQRYAAEHTSESTVRTVSIPSEEMKGRIIGREGRNIRAIEKATGVDIIVDDTPGVIVVSCFDKVRQAVAAEALGRLIADGRVHPARVEEVVAQVQSEVNERILKAGKDTVLEVKLRGVHPKIVEAMGKLHYRVSYGQNVLRHSVEVAYLCQVIAEQLGLNGALARRCGFLHDIGKAMDHEMEGGHPKIGMDFARTHGEKEPVLNAIGGHHADIPSTSFYTPIVMAADAVSSSRPGARRESLEKYIQRLEHLQDIAMSHQGVNEAYAIQAGREVRVMVDAQRVDDAEAFLIAKRIADKVSEEMTFPGEIRVTVLRETRAVEFAR
ncbi:MAG: ribonuclease Y, partial [Planctomycetota bacterium]|nr:ribonuclease Y [Planctomycetota bacterium]